MAGMASFRSFGPGAEYSYTSGFAVEGPRDVEGGPVLGGAGGGVIGVSGGGGFEGRSTVSSGGGAGGKAMQCGGLSVSCGGAKGGVCSGAGAGCSGSTHLGSMMSYVGVGDYVQETTYKYVGAGAGTHTVVPVVAPGPNYCLCLVPLLLLLLIPLFLMMSSRSSTTPPVAPPPLAGPQRSCTVYGDPHVITFDGSHEDYYTPGEYWIVKSDTVFIQGAYGALPMTNGLAVTKAIAIGGPFLQGHKLVIRTLDVGQAIAMYDGQPALSGFPDSFQSGDGLVRIEYNSEGGIIQYGRGGKQKHVMHISLPLGVNIQVNQWNEASEGPYMNLKIAMQAQPNQDGHCGNSNGNPADDARTQVRARVGKTGVPAGPDFLFPWAKTPINPANRPDMNDCPTGTLKHAKDVCRKKEGSFFPTPACLTDICFGGGVM